MRCAAEGQIILSLTTCFITTNICSNSKISNQHYPLTIHFRLARYWSKVIDCNLPHLYLALLLGVTSLEFRRDCWHQYTRVQRTTPTFDTMTDIMTDEVKDECVVTDGSMLYSLPRSCLVLVHTADSCANEGWFSCDQVIT